MRATLDWSYGLLSEAEQTALRRLSIFAGDFTFQAAGAVISGGARFSNQAVDHVSELIAKSLVATEMSNADPRLRLLKTTHAYAFAKLTDSGELDAVARRHLKYFGDATPRRSSI